jgi:hypothetical protein
MKWLTHDGMMEGVDWKLIPSPHTEQTPEQQEYIKNTCLSRPCIEETNMVAGSNSNPTNHKR